MIYRIVIIIIVGYNNITRQRFRHTLLQVLAWRGDGISCVCVCVHSFSGGVDTLAYSECTAGRETVNRFTKGVCARLCRARPVPFTEEV